MKSVLCFGEALIDFLSLKSIEQDKIQLPAFRQYPGGAPANAAVAVAKLGGDAKFAGQVGQDTFGDFLQSSLEGYSVDTQYLVRHREAKTALAFVSLDEQGDRSFSFYRDNSADLLFDFSQVDPDWFSDQPILHYCSNTLTTSQSADTTAQIVELASTNQSLVSFDVNLRHNLWATQEADRVLVNSLVWRSDLVKFSKEELLYLSGNNPATYIENCLNKQCQLLVVTDGGGSIEYFNRQGSGVIAPPTVQVADTTAGGDAFVGGMLFVLSLCEEPVESLSDQSIMSAILTFACSCGALAVTLPGAFPALPNQQAVLELLIKNNNDISAVSHLLNGHSI